MSVLRRVAAGLVGAVIIGVVAAIGVVQSRDWRGEASRSHLDSWTTSESSPDSGTTTTSTSLAATEASSHPPSTPGVPDIPGVNRNQSSAGTTAGGAGFVSARGTQLVVNGRPYTTVGVNAYELATLWGTNPGCGTMLDDAARPLLCLAPIGGDCPHVGFPRFDGDEHHDPCPRLGPAGSRHHRGGTARRTSHRGHRQPSWRLRRRPLEGRRMVRRRLSNALSRRRLHHRVDVVLGLRARTRQSLPGFHHDRDVGARQRARGTHLRSRLFGRVVLWAPDLSRRGSPAKTRSSGSSGR